MTKITFENLPSTNTPLNASNLNQLQTNVENAIDSVENELIEKTDYKYIKATISAVQTISSDSLVNLNTLDGDTTDGAITLSNGTFVIGSGISMIEVSGGIFCQSVNGTSGNYIWQRIQKNTTHISTNIGPATSHFISVVLPPVPVSVQQGDVIKMIADNTGSSGELRAGSANTYLMIKIIK